MNGKYQYKFPEKDLFRAMEVTEPEFDIFDPGRESLYVTLQPMRSPRQFERIMKELGIYNNTLKNIPNDYVKILFSGHRGCGKTVELLRFHHQIHQPDKYFSVFVSLQEEIEINRLEPEDLYFILINKLLRTLDEEGVPYDEGDFEDIAREWVSDKEVVKELSHRIKSEGGVEAKAGFSFWKILSAQGFLKSFYGYDNATTTKIRRTIKQNPDQLARRLNAAFVGLRQSIEKSGRGKDLLFIIDDFEKASPKVYNAVFIEDPQFILQINAHLISCVPIQTFYQVQNQAASDYFKTSYLPMIHTEEDNGGTFAQIVTRRVDASLFAPGVLDSIVRMSGGSPRQLLRIANQCLLDADGQVTAKIAEEAFRRLAVERMRPLSGKHRDILAKRNFDDASTELLDLLYALNVMEYNGDNIVRRLNPLLEPFFPPPVAENG